MKVMGFKTMHQFLLLLTGLVHDKQDCVCFGFLRTVADRRPGATTRRNTELVDTFPSSTSTQNHYNNEALPPLNRSAPIWAAAVQKNQGERPLYLLVIITKPLQAEALVTI